MDRESTLLARLESASADERENAAELVTDWLNSIDSLERRVLIQRLAVVAAEETDRVAREAELHAIAELSQPGAVTPDDVGPILQIPVHDLDPAEREYLQGLREDLEGTVRGDRPTS